MAACGPKKKTEIAELDASTPGEARERLLHYLEMLEVLPTPGVLEQAAANA
jgi:hypothetical protein